MLPQENFESSFSEEVHIGLVPMAKSKCFNNHGYVSKISHMHFVMTLYFV